MNEQHLFVSQVSEIDHFLFQILIFENVDMKYRLSNVNFKCGEARNPWNVFLPSTQIIMCHSEVSQRGKLLQNRPGLCVLTYLG